MKKCLIYGNCQTSIITQVFLETNLVSEYDFIYINCYDNNKNNIEHIDISNFDLIITQPIYQQTEPKTTLGVLSKKKKDCIVIIIHSLHFHYYFPNLIYLKIKEDQLNFPIAYHDKNLINLYLKYGKDEKSIIENYKELIFSNNFYDENIYSKFYQSSINDLKERFLNHSNLYKDFYPIYFLPITDFIEKNYQDELLWHSHIHPRYDPVLKSICIEILSILNKETELPNNFYYGDYDNQLPLYQSISSSVNFDTKNYLIPKINKKLLDFEDFVSIYLKIYSDNKNNKYLNNYQENIKNGINCL